MEGINLLFMLCFDFRNFLLILLLFLFPTVPPPHMTLNLFFKSRQKIIVPLRRRSESILKSVLFLLSFIQANVSILLKDFRSFDGTRRHFLS